MNDLPSLFDSPAWRSLPQSVLCRLLGNHEAAHAYELAEECLAIAKEAVTPGAVYLDDGRVRVGNRVIKLTCRRAAVIDALVTLGSATKSRLEKESGCDDAVTILRETLKSHPELRPFIKLPGKPGAGGYSTTIVDGSSKSR